MPINVHHARPTELPKEWLDSKPLPDCMGCYASWVVVRNVGGYHPFVTHMAYWNDERNEWGYEHGHYMVSLVDVAKDFEERCKKYGV